MIDARINEACQAPALPVIRSARKKGTTDDQGGFIMKKYLRKLAFALLALLTLFPLLAATPTIGAAEPPQTHNFWCRVCEQNVTGNFVSYVYYSSSEHQPMYQCPTCSYRCSEPSFKEPHTGGTATCTKKAVCSVCGCEYGDPLGHDWAFSANNDQTHVRTCQRDGCGDTETVPCTLDSANCVRGAQCSGCKAVYGEIDPSNHDWGRWTCNGDMTHYRACNLNANHTETGNCSLWEADCKNPSRCSVCWGWYSDVNPNKHRPYFTRSNGNGTHTIKCEHNASTTHDTIERCYGDSSATCQQKGKCSACGGEYYADHVFTRWISDSGQHAQPCDVCYGAGNGVFRNLGAHFDNNRDHQCDACGWVMSTHSFEAHAEEKYLASAATCVSKARYYEHCSYCGQMSSSTFGGDIAPDNHDLTHVKAQAPTCTEVGWNAYDTCTRCDYTTYVEIPANLDNHALIHVKAQAPTCTDHGWDAYDICQRCGYTTFKELPALGHWYGEWTPNGDGTQIAACKRGCGHKAKVKCAELEYALPWARGRKACEFTLCPVCGQVSDGTRLALVEKVTAKAVTRWLPAGEAVLRLGTLENGEIVLIAGFEYAGQLTQPTGRIQFTLPAEHLEGFTLTVITPDGTETPLDYTTEKDEATFTLDFTDTKTPTILIHLTPEA